ncbi:kinase-like domain protein [Rutstroemia sp. NJR-2017a WRK4]|nr:kinase-like domain protein [Rutstroemia sp. NJR-2017a WRK4]
MESIHNVDHVIERFFTCYTTVTRTDCDELATYLVGGRVTPVAIQGGVSYTLVGGSKEDKIVQFRPESSRLDMENMRLARSIHGDWVADCELCGAIGSGSSRLHVYVIQRLHGVTYFENEDFKDGSSDVLLRRSNTIRDLAIFFAQSWTNEQEVPEHIVRELRRDREHKLDVLINHMPSRFTGLLKMLREEMTSLFVSPYPLVLTHDDPCKMNILIDPDTGRITGIIDWADPSIEPFGFALWGLENLLGYEDESGWHYYAESDDLRKLFWVTFEDKVGSLTNAEIHNIQVARMLGIAVGYGISWRHRNESKPITEASSSMKYLDAFCLQAPWVLTELYPHIE